MKSYSKFIKEASSVGYVVTFGRFNPPTIGHEKLIAAVETEAKIRGFEYFIFPSRSYDKKKNPIPADLKVDLMKKSYPKYSSKIVNDPNIKNVFDVATKIYEMGSKKGIEQINLVLMVGSDRLKEFQILNKYNGVAAKHGYYDFSNIEILSAGERDPDSDDVSGMSASKLRKFALENDYDKFKAGMSSKLSDSDVRFAFNTIRKELGHMVEDLLSKRGKQESDLDLFEDEEIEQKYIYLNNKKIIGEYEEVIEAASFLASTKKYVSNGNQIGKDSYQKVIESVSSLFKGIEILLEGTDVDVPRVEIVSDFSEILEENKKYTTLSSVKNKDHFYKYLSDRRGISKREAEKYVDELLKKQSAHLKRRKSSDYGVNDESRLDKILKTYWKETGQDGDSQYTKKYKEKFSTEEKEIVAVRNKSDETGVPYDILYQVYRRGMGASKTSGTRPGMTPQQWALARINSFVTGGKTTKKADADLYDKAKKYLKEEEQLVLSEGMAYHLEKSRSIVNNIYRPHTEKFYSLFVEARELYNLGLYSPHSEFEEELLMTEAGVKANYNGKQVTLDVPFRGGTKKFRVYTRNEKGNVIKIDFGDPDLSVKTQDPDAIRSFGARHNCDQKTDKTKAGYWSCRLPKFQKELGLDFLGDPQWW